VHLDGLRIASTADLGNRIGVATLLLLISLVGGRIVPSFTRNWLAKHRPEISAPAAFNATDLAALCDGRARTGDLGVRAKLANRAWGRTHRGLGSGIASCPLARVSNSPT
jgi:hypothetical protein